MLEIPIKNPNPDFDNLAQVLSGNKIPQGIIAAELLIDEEVKKYIIEHYFHEINYPPPAAQRFGSSTGDNARRDTEEFQTAYRNYHLHLIDFYYRMGYHFIPDLEFYLNFSSLNRVSRVGQDTAPLSRGERYWAQEGAGMIRSWEDFKRFPWDKARKMLSDYGEHLEFLSKHLPDGMKIASMAALYEPVMEWLFGYEGLFYAVHDEPNLVKAVFDTYGQLIYESYVIAASIEGVGVIWHGDDLGFKTSTLLSPKHLRKWVFPWFRKYGEIAHRADKPFWYHCCGNKYGIMTDLIDYVNIDALHAFEDGCSPVTEFKKRYGESVGLIGGVDIDKLTRLDEENLRSYVRSILDVCMTNGRYIFGSGNSICNFVPVYNYLIMLDEGYRWAR
jgi:uroporphyrinogen decarboxylase